MRQIILLLLLSSACSAQTITKKQAQKLSDEIVSCIKKNSIYADSLNFETIEKEFDQQIDTMDTYTKVGIFYTRKLHQAGDNHSFYTNKATLAEYSKKQKENIGFKYELLDGDIGYLLVPGFLSTDNTVISDFANQINNAIKEMDSHHTIKGWVIDLRQNDGGNMWPMLIGLHGLNSSDMPGYFVNSNEKKPNGWKTNEPVSGINIKEPYSVKNPAVKIAVLYGGKTASSGEMTAISFIGQPSAKSFGEKTGGYTTSNRVFYLSNDNIFVLASSFSLDRNMKKYTGPIAPDVLIENTENNNVLKQAIHWIKE